MAFNFIFGGDTGETANSVQRKRALADALLKRSVNAAPTDLWSGLNSVADALLAVRANKQANAAENANANFNRSQAANLFRALGTGVSGASGSDTVAGSAGNDTLSGDIGAYAKSIKGIESGGRYDIVGPTHPKMGRALGAYQVMEANLPQWSRDALGREVSPDEFLANPGIQDAVFSHRFGGYVQKYGNPQDAASAWLTGRPRSAGNTARDKFGTDSNAYVSKFNAGLGSANGRVADALTGGGGTNAIAGGEGADRLMPVAPEMLKALIPTETLVGADVTPSGKGDRVAAALDPFATRMPIPVGGNVMSAGPWLGSPSLTASAAPLPAQAVALPDAAPIPGARPMPAIPPQMQTATLPAQTRTEGYPVPTTPPRAVSASPQFQGGFDRAGIGQGGPGASIGVTRGAGLAGLLGLGSSSPQVSPQAHTNVSQAVAQPNAPAAAQEAPQAGDSAPSTAQLWQAYADPRLDDNLRGAIGVMLKQRMSEADPANKLDMDLKRAQIANLERKADGTDETFFGNPVAIQTPDGIKYGQVGNKGGFKPINIGEGNTFAPPTKTVETPTEAIVTDNFGNVIARYPKDNRGAEKEKAIGKGEGEAEATANSSLGTAENTAAIVDQQIKSLKDDAYLPNMLGPVNSRTPDLSADAARVKGKIDQLQGGAFLQARQLLKGGGAITDFEGQKAEQAFTRMNRAQSVEDFKDALDDFNAAVKSGLARLRDQAGRAPTGSAPSPAANDPLGLR